MGRPLAIQDRLRIFDWFMIERKSPEKIFRLLRGGSNITYISLGYLRRLCRQLRDENFALDYVSGHKFSSGRPRRSDNEVWYLLEACAKRKPIHDNKTASRKFSIII